MSNPKISVIIPTFNSLEYLDRCVGSVAEAVRHYGNAELILVDNGSSDGTYERTRELFPQAIVARAPNVRIGAVRNRGARLGDGEYLAFVDSDCCVPPDFLNRAVEIVQAANADAVGCEYTLPSESVWHEKVWHFLHWPPLSGYTPYRYSSGYLLIRREAFEKAGGFSESLVTGEDAEIGLRFRRAGMRVFRANELPAYHMRNPKTLKAFFRKEIWRGLGMFGSLKTEPCDRPLIMTFLHLLLTLAGAVGLYMLPIPWPARVLAALLLTSAIPFASVLYRGYQNRRLYRPIQAIFLYHLYYDARVFAVFKILAGLTGR